MCFDSAKGPRRLLGLRLPREPQEAFPLADRWLALEIQCQRLLLGANAHHTHDSRVRDIYFYFL